MSDPRFRASDPASLKPLLDTARALAEGAGRATLAHFGSVLDSETKDDGTPVTLADREAETFLRREIQARFPDHGIIGEEFGEAHPAARIRWILDPIDGTRSFMRGVPLYAVLIGIEVDEEPVVGVAHFPALQESVAAARGLGCLWVREGREGPARVSSVSDLSRSLLLTTDPSATLASEVASGWRDLSAAAAFTRSWGDAYGHILVATGRAEMMVDPELAIWDAAPLLPIVEEAGGRFTSLQGERTIRGRSGLSSNGPLHPEALDRFSRS